MTRSTLLRDAPRLQLATCVTAAIVVWCWVLPWIASQPPMRERIERHQRQGINPSAMYYTELEVMQRILDDSD